MSQSEADDTGWRGTDEGSKLKSTGGWYGDGNGTDDYGFAAVPGGYRFGNGYFYGMGLGALFWSATEYDSSDAWTRLLYYGSAGVHRYSSYERNGFSLRLLRD